MRTLDLRPLLVVLIAIVAMLALVEIVQAQAPQGHLALRDATGHPIRAIFRPSQEHASADLMLFEERCVEIFDLDGDHLHWAPYDLERGTIAYWPSPCLPIATPVHWVDSACTVALVEPRGGVHFYRVGDQTMASSDATPPLELMQVYTSEFGGCDLVSFLSPRTYTAVRPMSDTSPWPHQLPGRKPFHVSFEYD